MENTKFENKNICRECGGKCCKKCGCDYSTDNFQDLSMKALEEILSEGKISIVAALNIKKSKKYGNCCIYRLTGKSCCVIILEYAAQ